jgi:hypothetical protein
MSKRRYIASLLAILHLAFIILPEIQLWRYISMQLESNYSVSITVRNDSAVPLTGDITYLNALLARSKEQNNDENKAKFPENNISHTSLIYLPGTSLFSHEISTKMHISYYDRESLFLDWLKRIPSPPPKSSFC